MVAANLEAAGTETSTWFLTARRFLAKTADDGNQTINLCLVQGSSKGRHIVLPLFNLRVYFRVGHLLGFGRTQILRSNRFSNHRITGPIGTVALGAGCVEYFLAF